MATSSTWIPDSVERLKNEVDSYAPGGNTGR